MNENVTPIRRRKRATGFLKRGVLIVGALFGAILVLIGLVIGAMGAEPGLAALRDALAGARPLLLALRLSAIYTLWHYWPTLIERLAARHGITEAGLGAALAIRHRVALCLLAIEALIGFSRITGGTGA